MCLELIAIFNLLKIRMRVDIFGTEKCKVTFGLKYMTHYHNHDKILNPDTAFCFGLTLMLKFSTSHIGCWDSLQT